MLELSIVIVNYRNQQLTTQCVQSIVEKDVDLDYELLVVDNQSNDNTEEKLRLIYPELRWFQMGYNSGFGRANNKGIREARGEYLLLLNSDVIVKSQNSIRDCLNKLKQLPNSNKTILGTRLVNTDGSYQETLRLEFYGIKREIKANPFNILIFDRILERNKPEKKEQYNAHYKSGDVAWINGAFLLMNRESIVQNNLFFDSDFFLYGEDMEWAWRANKLGFKFFHWHEQELVHVGSASMPDNGLKRCQVIVSDWLFIRKTRRHRYLSMLLAIVLSNLFFDGLLYQLAKIRRKSFSKPEEKEHAFRPIYLYLLKHYGWLILSNKKLSSEKKFQTNCYEDSVLANKIKQSIA